MVMARGINLELLPLTHGLSGGNFSPHFKGISKTALSQALLEDPFRRKFEDFIELEDFSSSGSYLAALVEPILVRLYAKNKKPHIHDLAELRSEIYQCLGLSTGLADGFEKLLRAKIPPLELARQLCHLGIRGHVKCLIQIKNRHRYTNSSPLHDAPSFSLDASEIHPVSDGNDEIPPGCSTRKKLTSSLSTKAFDKCSVGMWAIANSMFGEERLEFLQRNSRLQLTGVLDQSASREAVHNRMGCEASFNFLLKKPSLNTV
ncbi:hypothetical protein Ciccas_009328 [Cichlidogyrus casuarinus]|uniref:Uncharacterized protein n=1 Tax=Cichlidogyrus casuarinus TaxID=1844966 RepID=A0ABD2Q040_9PLAT